MFYYSGCSSNTYGINCNEICPEHCLVSASSGQSCNIINGSCLNGCDDWWKGPMCKDSIGEK